MDTSTLDKINEYFLTEDGAHDTIKDQYIKNFNTIWLDTKDTITNLEQAFSEVTYTTSELENKPDNDILRSFIKNKRSKKGKKYSDIEKYFYFTKDNCIFHHINGNHNANHITNVLLIRSNSKRNLATAAHMFIHMHALLLAVANFSKIDLSKLINLNTEAMDGVELWTFSTTNNQSEADIDYQVSQIETICDETMKQIKQAFDNGIDIEDRVIKQRTSSAAKDTYTKILDRLKTAKTYGGKYSLRKWQLHEYLNEFGTILSEAASTQNFLTGYKQEDQTLKTKTESFDKSLNNINLLDLVEAYYNQLNLSRALENKDECIKLIRDFYGYNGPIETGGFYIMPDGTAIKSTNHSDIDKFLIKNKFITGKVEDYGDGSQFMDAINCVRIRRRGGRDTWILPYMILPEKQLTQAQYSIIKDWISFVLDKSGVLQVETMTNNHKIYHANEVTTEDIIFEIKLYYRTRILEQVDYDILFEDYIEDDIDDTDYELKYTEQDYDNMWDKI